VSESVPVPLNPVPFNPVPFNPVPFNPVPFNPGLAKSVAVRGRGQPSGTPPPMARANPPLAEETLVPSRDLPVRGVPHRVLRQPPAEYGPA
jgi:hypothetical protein